MGLYHNARYTDAEHSRGILVFLFIWVFFLFSSTFAHLIIAAIDSAEVAGGLVGLLTVMMFTFCGYVLHLLLCPLFFNAQILTHYYSILASPTQMPDFWIFMYRVNPFTYFVDGFVGTALSNAPATCSDNEFVFFNIPNGTTCGEYIKSYIEMAGGFVQDSSATDECRFCQISETNRFLSNVSISFANRWRNFGLMWVFVVFNVLSAIGLYWLARVPKKSKVKKE